MRHVTYCALRLGDNLAHAHFLRRLSFENPGDQFVHYLHTRYADETRQVVEDRPNVQIKCLLGKQAVWWNEQPNEPAINAWKNAGLYWERHPRKLDYADFMLCWFAHLAGQMGLDSPLHTVRDLLFDYPRLGYYSSDVRRHPYALVVNSRPMSNQAPGYSIDEMDEVIAALAEKYERVFITEKRDRFFLNPRVRPTSINNFTVTDIGKLSQRCDILVLVSTGPSWPCLNIWNADNPPKFVGLINGDESVTILPSTIQIHSVAGMTESLRREGIL